MATYQCPQCNGGFPEPKPGERGPECPWCGAKLNGEPSTKSAFDIPTGTTSNGITNLRPSTDRGIGPTDSGTTPCPDCGEDMPMTSWVGPKPKCEDCREPGRNAPTQRTIDTSGVPTIPLDGESE